MKRFKKTFMCSLILTLMITISPCLIAQNVNISTDNVSSKNLNPEVNKLSIDGRARPLHSKEKCFVQSSSQFIVNEENEEVEFPFFLSFGSGVSFSRTSKIIADPIVWDPAVEGYNNKLHHTAIYSAGFGYELTKIMRVSVDATYRPAFKYRKFQTRIPNGPQVAATDQKTRKFDLSNKSLMVNIAFNGQALNLYTQLADNTILQPFIGGGIGISNNQISNFHSVLTTQNIAGFGLNDVSVVGDSIKSKTSFAWQLEGGFEMLYCQKFGIELGYRYFDGGKFKSTDHIIPGAVPFLPLPYAIGAVQTTPWIGKLRAQELYFKLKYHFY